MNEDWALVPVKGLTESKTRLSNYLGDKKRLFIEALLGDVLSSITRSRVFDKVLVISPDKNVANLAQADMVVFVPQTSIGLNRAIEQATRLSQAEKALSVTTILADIPLAEPRDFAELFNLGEADRKLVVAPSLKGGTNVMMVRPPGAIQSSYGRWSYSRHLRQAQAKGLTAYSISNSRLSLDIDTGRDLFTLKHSDPHIRTMSARVLQGMGHLESALRERSARDQTTHY